MQKRIFISVILTLTLLVVVSAQTCAPISVTAKTTSALLAEIPSINTKLQTCPFAVPPQATKLIKDGILLVEISDAEDIAITISQGMITGVNTGSSKYTYKIVLASCQLDAILQSSDKFSTFMSYVGSGSATIQASGFLNKIKLWFGKKVLKGTGSAPVDACAKKAGTKPENCFETYLPGYTEYSDPKVKEEWDKRSSETAGVCQTQTSERPKGDCKYTYEQIKNNDKKWVCWYN